MADKLERFQNRRLSNASARMVVEISEEAGLAARPLLAEAGLQASELADPGHTLLGSQQIRLERAFVRETLGRPELWLELGFRYRLLSYGPVGSAALNARRVERAVELIIGFQELTFTVIDYTMLHDSEGRLCGFRGETTFVPEDLREFMVIRDLAAIRRLLDDMILGSFPIGRIRAEAPSPAGPDDFAGRLGAPIQFGAPVTEVHFDDRWRGLSMPYGNPILEETYERQCRDLLATLVTSSTEVERVVDLLVRRRGRWPTLQEAARTLGLAERTLRRRLAEQNTSFRSLLQSVRRQQAEELLRDTGLTVEEVADALGYAETASFTHAFRRWTGRSPSELRRSG